MTVQPQDCILIIDFGSQVTQLIARRVREAGVYCEIAPFGSAEAALDRLRPKGVILSGGPARSEEHTSELQSLMRISYAVFCLKKKKEDITTSINDLHNARPRT